MVNKTDFIASLAKGLRVIECFSADQPRMSITDVANQTEFDRATARRILLTLSELGYADYDGKFFQLTPRVLRLGMSALAALPLPQIVQPWLDQLSARTGQSCSVSILDDIDIVYVARTAAARIMSIGLMPGSRLPAHCTSMGRVLLANLAPEEARTKVEKSDLSPRTAFSLTDPDEIMRRLDQIRRDGFALIDQEVELGVRSIAVPIRNVQDRTVAALNIGMGLGEDDLVETYLPALLEVQKGLARVLR